MRRGDPLSPWSQAGRCRLRRHLRSSSAKAGWLDHPEPAGQAQRARFPKTRSISGDPGLGGGGPLASRARAGGAWSGILRRRRSRGGGWPRREASLDLLHGIFAALRRFPKPAIGAIQRLAVAGGLELALCCDPLVAAASARMGDGHVLFGLIPGGGAATMLPRRIGLACQAASVHRPHGKRCNAAGLGLINVVVPDAEMMSAAGDLARHLASLSPEALTAMKSLSSASMPDELLAREAAAMRAHLQTATAAEGLAAFRAKRRPSLRPAPDQADTDPPHPD